MKVLLVANINSTHTKKWALALKEKQVQVALFSLNAAVLNDPWYDQLDQVFHPAEDKESLFKYIKLYFELKEQIRSFAPDIVHSHFVTNYSLIANLTGFRKHMVTAWGSDVYFFPKKSFINRLIVKYNLAKAASILSTSHAMAKEIARYTSKPVNVVPFGIDFRQITPRAERRADTKAFNIGFFKKIEPVYAPEILIKAFHTVCQKLPDYDLKLTLAGDGSEMKAMMKLSEELGISKQVIFLGWVNPSRVPELLQSTDLCVYVSRNESFGVALLEAMAAKIPLVVTRTVGFLEVAGNEDTVLFTDFDDAEQAAAQIIRLITDKDLYNSLAQKAYEHARKNFALDANISEQIRLYENLVRITI